MPLILQHPDCPPVAIPVQEPVSHCKVCDGPAHLHGVVDMNRTCREVEGLRVYHLQGVPIYYYRCTQCGFLFSRAFDHWTVEQFNEWIYDEGYINVDPDYVAPRPTNYARTFAEAFAGLEGALAGLDYGGGSGLLAGILRSKGFDYDTWDPMHGGAARPPRRGYNFISAVEVLEHTPDPMQLFRDVGELLDEDGVFLFSTIPCEIAQENLIMIWWYVAPANGHISIMTLETIRRLCQKANLKVVHKGHVHIAYRRKSEILGRILARLNIEADIE